MKNNPAFVSVIMPVFNAEKYVVEAIESVLSQTHKNIELICINDGSTDNSLDILRSFGDKIIVIDCEKNLGTSEARNKGIHVARGNLLAFLDADDFWKNDKLEIQVNCFENNSNLDVSFTYMTNFLSPELHKKEDSLHSHTSSPIPGYIPSTLVIKKTSFEKVGYFDPKWKNGEFVAWLVKAREVGLISEVVNEVLAFRRIHETNKGVAEKSVSTDDYLKITREFLNKKRANSFGDRKIK
jgi:glycosyltransferase involved in cell wall biosynthesis